MSGINATNGCKLFIGGVASIKVPVQADYEADSYIEVGSVESIGNFGDKSSPINFTSLSDNRTQKLKGSRDAGDSTIVVGDDPSDDGQAAMIAAEGQTFDYNFYVEFADKLSPGGLDSKHYFYGKVMSKEVVVGATNNVVKRNFVIGINSPTIDVDPT